MHIYTQAATDYQLISHTISHTYYDILNFGEVPLVSAQNKTYCLDYINRPATILTIHLIVFIQFDVYLFLLIHFKLKE